MAFRLESQTEPIPGYRLLERLGAGGFGEVWKVEAPGGLQKAIKFVYGDLKANDAESLVRAEQELKALDRIKSVRHPYILSLERFDIINGQLMIVMELADRSLWDRFRDCRNQSLPGIPRDELLRYLEEAAEALDMMNEQHQLQHLDIKPQNLFLLYNHVKVADFGLVKALASTSASVTGGVTPVYAAPEMFDGRVSRYCDQYSLAIVYQELLTGQRPFAANNVHQLIMQHVQGQPNLGPLPETDQPIVARALAKTPEDRYPNCLEFVHTLRGQTATAPATAPVVAGNDNDPFAPTEPRVTNNLATPVRSAQTTTVESSPKPAAAVIQATPTVSETKGNGELFPALVIGVGDAGRTVLSELHNALCSRFGSRDAVPHIRLLYLDTDVDAIQAATQGSGPAALQPGEAMAMRLQRPSYYLKHKEGRPGIETWCQTALLYRIRRSQRTDGLRALGRLAFLDSYRPIVERLRDEIQACCDPESLTAAQAGTGLSLRSNWPRVYVAASLGGGTGGGMFIDLAYVLRATLRELGYPDAQTIGLLLLPALGKKPAHIMALGNSYAALTELHHFATPEVVFNARYDTREAPISEAGPPFSRCLVAPLSESCNSGVPHMLAQIVCRELTTPLGRVADTRRDECQGTVDRPSMDGALRVSSAGLFRLCWDRPAVVRQAGIRFCQQLIKRWISKDSKPLQPAVAALVQEQWTRIEMAADFLIARLQEACTKSLGQPADQVLTDILSPFTDAKRLGPESIEALMESLDALEQLIGRPSSSSVLDRHGSLENVLHTEGDALIVEYGRRLADITLPLVDDPSLRLAGTEEALRQLNARIEQLLQHQEPLCQELTAKAAQGYERLHCLRANLPEILSGGRRNARVVAELIELLKLYPKWRYQSLVLRRVCLAYTSLRGHLSDQLRDVAFCRVRLGELQQHFAAALAESPNSSSTEGRLPLYPPGCADENAAAERLVAEATPEDLADLDEQMQEMVQQQFRGLLHVCTTSANLLKQLEQAMLAEAEAFAGTRLAQDDVVEMFLARYPSEQEATDGLAQAWHVAEPRFAGLSGADETQFAVLAAPASPFRQRLFDLVPQVADAQPVADAVSPDDIVLYREETDVLLSDLEHLGEAGRQAYEQLATAENFTPHCRTDITEWQAVTPGG